MRTGAPASLPRLGRTALAAAALFLAGCSAEDRAQMESDKLDSMNLSASERAIAAALVEGYKKEVGLPVLRSRDYARAACYAKSVDMPPQFARVHEAYLKDYVAIDRDYYPWFRRQGVDEQAAYRFYGHVEKGFDTCSFRALLRRKAVG